MPMPIIDAQVHAYAADTPDRPWAGAPNWPAHVTGDEMVAAMDAVGVDGAILISAYSIYRYDASYAVEVRNAHPGRFALVKPVDPSDPAAAETIAAWKETDGTVGTRILMNHESSRGPDDPGFAVILRESARLGLPVNLACAGAGWTPAWPGSTVTRNFLHSRPYWASCSPTRRRPRRSLSTELPKVLKLARRENAVIKITARAPFPMPATPTPISGIR